MMYVIICRKLKKFCGVFETKEKALQEIKKQRTTTFFTLDEWLDFFEIIEIPINEFIQ